MINKNSKNKLFNKNFYMLWQGQFISRIGSQIYFMAMVLWLKDEIQSATLLGLLGMLSGIPSIFLSTIGGIFADRYSRKIILIICDIISAISVLALAYIFYFTASGVELIVMALIVTSLISGIVASFFTPAISAAIPDILPKEKLTAGNSFIQASGTISTISGWSLSGILYQSIGMPLLVLINGLTFIFAAFTKTFIHIPNVIVKNDLSISRSAKFKRDLKEGLKYVWNYAGLRKLVIVSLIMNFFSIPILLLLPFYVDLFLHLDNQWIAYFLSISSIGSVFGYTFASLLRLNAERRSKFVVSFMVINAIFTIWLSMNTSHLGAIIIYFSTGFLGGFVTVNIQTIMQISTAQEIRGRVFGFISTVTGALSPIGMGLAGVIGDLTNKNIPLIYSVCGFILLILTLYVSFNTEIKKFLSFSFDDNIDNKEILHNTEAVKEEELIETEEMLNVKMIENLKIKLKNNKSINYKKRS